MSVRRLRLRRPGTCAICFAALEVGQEGLWDSDCRTVTCMACASDSSGAVESGVAGASAMVEAERLRAKQEARHQHDIEAHPILGRLAWAIDPEPDAGRHYAKGAVGEQRLGASFDELHESGVLTLHDRRLPGSKANIDHIVVAATGVWVVDAKRYSGRLSKVDKGGWFRTDVRLTVGGRDRTKLIAGVHKQVAHVEHALLPVFGDDLPIRGVLCFIDVELGLFAKPFSLDKVLITWGEALRKLLVEQGPLDDERRSAIHRRLAQSFPRGG